MKYCTYIRFRGITGLLYGWFLVGISERKHTSGYVTDYAKYGISVILLEIETPLITHFHFVPRNAIIIGKGMVKIF